MLSAISSFQLSTTGTNKESLIRAYVKYVQPLPCRDEQSSPLISSQKLSNRHQIRCCQSTDTSNHRSHLKLSSNTTKERKNRDLDNLVVINNPKWPTSGVTPVEEKKVSKVESKTKESNKRPVPDSEPTSSSSQLPLKRPKINRNFDGLEELLGKNKFLA
ncbi:unnamed protein product [Hymenolepis diminuta]|uniref:Ashwin n=1 Tax=Hymenolepis diminuta TaxID=6216 RepID=A0A0R3S7N1_HYMDI|nr:unnamed protein product [Hymenolepis diminuta]